MSVGPFIPPTIPVFGGALTELNRMDPNRADDMLRRLADAAGNQGFGSWLNSIAVKANAANSGSAAAAKTSTIAGTPAAGDVISAVLTVPVNQTSPSSPSPTIPFNYTLTSGDAATATTAAAAVVAAWNAIPGLFKYILASNAAGVVSWTSQLKGPSGNSLKVTTSKSGAGTTTITAGGALTGGTGVDDTPLITDT